MIGPYQIIQKLGQGGMGEVFLVQDTINHRQVALKKIRSDLKKSQKSRDRFIHEAKVTSGLVHPAIIPIYAINDQPAYFTMPYIQGQTLQHILDEEFHRRVKGLHGFAVGSVKKLTHVFLQVCHAVAYAHSQGFIHRDLKPSNIMLGKFGEVRLLDWGLVTEIDRLEVQKESLAGTIIYFAPELSKGKPFSRLTEIYALGLVLYQILTLRYPFHREGIVKYFENLEKEVLLSPIKVAPERNIPIVISELALKCLAFHPQDRLQNVEEIIDCLEDLWLHTENKIISPKCTTLQLKKQSNPINSLDKLSIIDKDHQMKLIDAEIEGYHELLHSLKNSDLLNQVRRHLFDRLATIDINSRRELFQFVWLVVRFIPQKSWDSTAKSIIQNFRENLSHDYFVDQEALNDWPETIQNVALSAHLAFLLSKSLWLSEIFYDLTLPGEISPLPILGQILISLTKLREFDLALYLLNTFKLQFLDIQAIVFLDWLQQAIMVYQNKSFDIPFLKEMPKVITYQHLLPIFLIFEEAISCAETSLIDSTINHLIDQHQLTAQEIIILDTYLVWAYLIDRNWDKAGAILKWHSEKNTKSEKLEFLNQCWLYATKGITFELNPINTNMFDWEKQQLYSRYILFYKISLSS